MKSNLDNLFETSKEHETEGVWLNLKEDVGFLVKRFGGFNSTEVKSALAKYYKPYASQVENKTLPAEKEREIMTRVFVESSVTDWKGIEIDGQIKNFSKEDCVKLLVKLPDLADTLFKYAGDRENYKVELGNF
jgi:hypothetical protein